MFSVLSSSSNTPEHPVSRIKKFDKHWAYGFVELSTVNGPEWNELIYVSTAVFSKNKQMLYVHCFVFNDT